MNEDWMKRLNTMIMRGEHKQILSNKVLEVEGKSLTEEQLVREELKRMATIRVSERELVLPGLGDPNVQEAIVAAVADFKKEANISRAVKPEYIASTDDITLVELRPQMFDAVTGNWIRTYAAPGTARLLPNPTLGPGPIGIGQVNNAGAFQIDPRQVRLVITDLVEYDPNIPVQAVQFTVDNDTRLPYEIRKEVKTQDIAVYRLPSPEIVRVSVRIDARAEAAATSELTPYGVAIIVGELVPPL